MDVLLLMAMATATGVHRPWWWWYQPMHWQKTLTAN